MDALSCLCGAVVRDHTAVARRKVAWERFRLWIHFTDRCRGGKDRERRIAADGKKNGERRIGGQKKQSQRQLRILSMMRSDSEARIPLDHPLNEGR